MFNISHKTMSICEDNICPVFEMYVIIGFQSILIIASKSKKTVPISMCTVIREFKQILESDSNIGSV